MMTMIVNHVSTVSRLPNLLSEELVLRSTGPIRMFSGMPQVKALNLLQKHNIRIKMAQALSQLVNHHFSIELRKSLMDIVSNNMQVFLQFSRSNGVQEFLREHYCGKTANCLSVVLSYGKVIFRRRVGNEQRA
jgi:hypothetical protein